MKKHPLLENYERFFGNILESKIDPDVVKKHASGYVGTDFAKKATDEDIKQMVELMDEMTRIHNTQILPIKQQINFLRKKYKLKAI